MAFPTSQKAPARPSGKQFVEYLITRNILKPGFRSVLGGRDLQQVDQYLISKKLVTKEQLPRLYAEYFGLPLISLADQKVDSSAAGLIPEEVARKYTVVAYELSGTDIYIAVGRPSMLQQSAPNSLLKLRQQKGLDIHLSISSRDDVLNAIDRVYGSAPVERKEEESPEPKRELPTTTIPVKSDLPPTPPPISPPPIAPSSEPIVAPKPEPVKPAPTVEPKMAGPALTKEEALKEEGEKHKEADLTSLTISRDVLKKIPLEVAKKYQIVAFGVNKDRGEYEPELIKIGVVDPDDIQIQEILAYIERKNKVLIDRYKISEVSLGVALGQYRAPSIPPVAIKEPETVEKPVHTKEVSSEPAIVLTEADISSRPTIDIDEKSLKDGNTNPFDDQDLDKLLTKPVNSPEDLAQVIRRGAIPEIISAILFLAIRMQASDVHIEAQRKSVRFRYRVDGILHDIISTPQFMQAPLISRIKILSKMKIDEQRVPQDGRFDVTIDKRQVDLRVSTLPTVFGEKVVMRLLDKTAAIMSLEQLGVTESNFDILTKNIEKPYGIILSTGPTGSGKTTTLYAVLNRISRPGVNVVTLEDPVEYELPGINQSQVKPQIGFSFAEGLRSVLRQDPNVIMVGEVRDLETAAMATHAALTGHLVLSTLHTNDASGALPRLMNMGVEPFLITSSINAVVGQRLVRKVCPDCRQKADIPPAVKSFIKKQLSEITSGQLKDINLEQLTFYKGAGCANCNNGYRGRIGIYEVLPMNEEIEELAVRKAPASEIKKVAIKNGMITMVQDGLIKALKGITTVDEVMRVTTSSMKDAPQE